MKLKRKHYIQLLFFFVIIESFNLLSFGLGYALAIYYLLWKGIKK